MTSIPKGLPEFVPLNKKAEILVGVSEMQTPAAALTAAAGPSRRTKD